MASNLRDQDVSDAWVQDRVERKAAHQTLQAVVTMLEAVAGPNLLARSRLPPVLHVMRLQRGQARRRGPHGFVIDSADATVDVVAPQWKAEELLIVHYNIDRCGIGGSAVAFSQCVLQVLWGVTWGRLHDSWNIINTAAKGAAGGRLWQGLVKFSSVTNLPLGPFQSTAWKSQMQDMLTTLTTVLGPDSVEFERAMERQQTLQPQRYADLGPAERRLAWWHFFCRLPSCTVRLCPAMKFSRWYSAFDCW